MPMSFQSWTWPLVLSGFLARWLPSRAGKQCKRAIGLRFIGHCRPIRKKFAACAQQRPLKLVIAINSQVWIAGGTETHHARLSRRFDGARWRMPQSRRANTNATASTVNIQPLHSAPVMPTDVMNTPATDEPNTTPRLAAET